MYKNYLMHNIINYNKITKQPYIYYRPVLFFGYYTIQIDCVKLNLKIK